MEAIDLSPYPPSPVTWAYTAVDVVCQPLGCEDWRHYLPSQWTARGAWLSGEFKLVRPIGELMPPLLTYKQYSNQGSGSGSFYGFAFQTPSTTLADLTTPSAICMLALLVIMLRRVKGLVLPRFSRLGRAAAIHTHGEHWFENGTNETRISKFGEYVFRLLFHSTISIAGIVYFWDKDWWKSGGTHTLWLEYPHQSISPGMTWYYLVQSAYNVEAMISLLEISFVLKLATPGKTWQFPGFRVEWSPNVRGDFREMFVHHIITNLLIIGSSYFRLTRVGSMASTAICFATMVVVWCITRLAILPFFIYKSVLQESWMVCTSGEVVAGGGRMTDGEFQTLEWLARYVF
eukprot:scaffold2214_cov139-Cylindrotheca_fusiformis.AAC.23